MEGEREGDGKEFKKRPSGVFICICAKFVVTLQSRLANEQMRKCENVKM
jgi:hypothetical protein